MLRPRRFLVTVVATAALLVALPSSAASGRDVARAAERRLQKPKKLVRNDCSGFVTTVLRDVGVTRGGSTSAFWKRAVAEGRVRKGLPKPGDLAFFDHTWDQNRNQQVDDPLSHIAVVVEVEKSGRVRLVHKGGSKVTEIFVTPKAPTVHKRKGRVMNSFLRAPGYGPKDHDRLTGELLRGFARPPVDEQAPKRRASARRSRRG